MCPILQLLHNHTEPATVPKRHNTLNNLTYSASKVERLLSKTGHIISNHAP
jgi:hypothetical protein